MCGWRTPAAVRLRCRCTKTWAIGGTFAVLCAVAFVVTHWLLLLGLAVLGLVVAALVVAGLRGLFARITGPMSVLVYQPDRVQPHAHPAASPAPAKAAPAVSDVVGAAEEIARQAWGRPVR